MQKYKITVTHERKIKVTYNIWPMRETERERERENGKRTQYLELYTFPFNKLEYLIHFLNFPGLRI